MCRCALTLGILTRPKGAKSYVLSTARTLTGMTTESAGHSWPDGSCEHASRPRRRTRSRSRRRARPEAIQPIASIVSTKQPCTRGRDGSTNAHFGSQSSRADLQVEKSRRWVTQHRSQRLLRISQSVHRHVQQRQVGPLLQGLVSQLEQPQQEVLWKEELFGLKWRQQRSAHAGRVSKSCDALSIQRRARRAYKY